MIVSTASGPRTLAEWVAGFSPPQDSVQAEVLSEVGLKRFVFYARASTAEHQDPWTSRVWQFDVASRLVQGHGVIVAEFFEPACSRQVPWPKRPVAAALLEFVADPANRVDAIVVGEYERAFDVGQLDALCPFLERHGVRLWLPEAGGPVEFGSPAHDALLAVLAARAHAEVIRARHRVLVAMRMQTVEQGRYLGGRPPYGYRLVDAGAHPNQALARCGVRLHRLAPDPATARHVTWMFAQRLAGRSTAQIARRLNEQGVLGPSGADSERNRHHVDHGWSLRTVTEILHNPRYTGYQVWNRASGDRTDRTATGRRPTTRNDRQDWVVSNRVVHQPLVSEQDFLTVQTIRAERAATDAVRHAYRLFGKLHCGLSGRRMDSHRVHDRPAYRCRHGHTSSRTRPTDTPGNLYLREDQLLARIAEHLTVAGIATNPTPEDTARLVDELDLEFRCDTTSVALLEPRAVAPRAKSIRGRVTGPAVQPDDFDPADLDPAGVGVTGDDTACGQLTLDLCFGAEVEAVADSPEPVDRSVGTSRGSRSASRRGRRTRTGRSHDARSTGQPRPGRASAVETIRRVHVAWPDARHRHPLIDESEADGRTRRWSAPTSDASTASGLRMRGTGHHPEGSSPRPLDLCRREPTGTPHLSEQPANTRWGRKRKTPRRNPDKLKIVAVG